MTLPTTAAETWLSDIFNAVESDISACGWFDRVGMHEPKNAPGHGLSCAVWLQDLRTVRSSGLAASSALVTFQVRIYTSMVQEPQDAIDPAVFMAISNLTRTWHDNYDLGLHPLVRNVDLLGQEGTPLSARAGYVEQSGTLYRVGTIVLPIICNDIWPQGSI
jgi:hypothetical protein